MHYKVIKDPIEAKAIWDALSPKRVIDDEWDFRYAFYKHLPYSLHFIVGQENGDVVGMLPMQHNNGYGLKPPYADGSGDFLEFFGGDDTDDNRVIVKNGYEEITNSFFNQVNQKAYFAPLASGYKNNEKISFYESKYILPLQEYANSDDFLDKNFNSVTKGKIKRGVKKLYKEYEIEVSYNNYEDLELLFTFNQERFGETSSFRYEYRKDIFRDLIKLFNVEMITVSLNGKKEAVSYAIRYNNTYVSMNMGYNPTINNLGKLLILLQVQRAIDLGCTMYDGGKGDSGWKEQFKFQQVPQFQLAVQK